MNHGYVIMAQNTDAVDYVKCATVLALRIKEIMPKQSVSIITNDSVSVDIFDHVISLPHGDVDNTNWKLANDWQVYWASPYEYTIKLEADLFLPRKIDHWWNILKSCDLNLMTIIRNYKNEISTVDYYRKSIVKNNLPNIYNAITYFKKGELAEQFFTVVRDIFENWSEYSSLLNRYAEARATTDVVYSIAAHIIGHEKCTLPTFRDMSMIHMKKEINDIINNIWYHELICEILPETMRVNSYTQLYPFHYHIKEFSDIIIRNLYESKYPRI